MNDNIENILVQILDGQKELSQSLADLKSDVVTLKDDVSNLKSDVSTLKDDVSDLKSDVTILKDDVKNINKKIDNVYTRNSDLTELKKSTTETINTIFKDVQFIKHKLRQNEEDVFSIQRNLKIVK